MPPQSVEIAETIAALKRALRREKEGPSEQQISSATNRGNKLKRGANFVHAGSLPYRYTRHGYKERIEHAGYQRYILNRNPKRYDEYGHELEESESDQEADADAEDENPYSEVRLEELLRPLTHPSDLENHPTFSQAYLDPALPEMVKTTEEKLRQERANLWRAKNLHRQFIGDESWMPCVSVEQPSDWDLFDPLTSDLLKTSSGRKRKREGMGSTTMNGISGQLSIVGEQAEGQELLDTALLNGNSSPKLQPVSGDNQEQFEDRIALRPEPDTKSIDDRPIESTEQLNGVETTDFDPSTTRTNGTFSHDAAMETDLPATIQTEIDEKLGDNGNHVTTREGNEEPAEGEADADIEESPPPPPRRITRALAATNPSNTATPPLSPISSAGSSTEVDSTLLQIHPIYLLPPSVQIAHSTHQQSNLPLHVAHSGLPIDEILETRRLIGMYIQKQEETIRGLEGVLGKLIKAKRMRDQIYEWCKAEGHVGEWSDGEDWVDTEFWGINASELRKGKDEDNNEEEEATGRKPKRRRVRERE